MRIHRRRFTLSGVFVVALAMLFGGLYFYIDNSRNNVQAFSESGRLMTVHDNGASYSFLTEARDVESALMEAGFSLDSRDAVEPARDEVLIASDYKVNIYRARPVTVVDGTSRKRVMTAYQTVERIAKDANLELYQGDEAELVLSDDILGSGAGLELVVDRATPVTVDFFGKKTETRTQADTVAGLLDEKGVKLGANDRVKPSGDTAIHEGINIRVWREGKQTITVDEDVDFSVKRIEDADKPYGFREVRTPGVKGKRSVVYELLVQNGVEVNRKEVSSLTTIEPKQQVEVIGVKVAGPAEILSRIKYWSDLRGIDYNRVARIAKCESTFNPMASNGYHQGLFQHDPSYWPARAQRFGFAGASITDVEAQIAVSTGMMAGGGWSHWECK